MANKKHLNIIKQGITVWNEWRQKNPKIKPDLSDADLANDNFSRTGRREVNPSEVNLRIFSLPQPCSYPKLREDNLSDGNLSRDGLSGANLSESNLSRADLSWVNLGCADLYGADLSEANLSKANLSKANLNEANLSKANLNEANLSKANLNEANLSEANLYGADLSEANLSKANLTGADLRKTNLRKAKLNVANLTVADLSEANLTDADLSDADLGNANLIEAVLDFANLNKANLSKVHLDNASLCETNLSDVRLSGSYIRNAYFYGANLRGANLTKTDLIETDLSEANLGGAKLKGADLNYANLRRANLNGADLSGADLSYASLVETNLEKAILVGCSVYGISAWGLKIVEAKQSDLVITRTGEPTITVDNLEIAQFIYLLLNNEKLRDVINTITSKVVLILGRFGEHKAILDQVRNQLRKNNYVPIMFDFKTPANRDMTETVRTLAHLARFIIADITEPRSIPQELQAIIPDLAVPVQPLLLEGSTGEYAMFQDLRKKYHWVLETYQYQSLTTLLDCLNEEVIAPAEAKAQELEKRQIEC